MTSIDTQYTMNACPKCGEHNYELKERMPLPSERGQPLVYLECQTCGTAGLPARSEGDAVRAWNHRKMLFGIYDSPAEDDE